MEAFPDVRQLLPQRGSSCLLDAVLSAGPAGAECSASLPADHPYMTSTGVHPLLAIELFAQAAAVHRALAGEPGSAEPAQGVLAAAQVEVHADSLGAGTRLVVQIAPDASLGGLLRFVGQLYADDGQRRLLATGSVSVKLASKPELGPREGAA